MPNDTLLELSNLSVSYGEIEALRGVSLALDEGEIVALIGPNGSGKTTILKSIFGLAPIVSGDVRWHGSPFDPVPHEVVLRGISYVPQGRQIFPNLSVRENLEMGGILVRDKVEKERRIKEAFDIFPVLKKKIKARGGALSGGEQQMLALARGLITDPKVLLLDEPSLGLAPKLVTEVFRKIKEINERHKTAILIVEHNVKSLLTIADRVYLLDKGSLIGERSPEELVKGSELGSVFLSNRHA